MVCTLALSVMVDVPQVMLWVPFMKFAFEIYSWFLLLNQISTISFGGCECYKMKWDIVMTILGGEISKPSDAIKYAKLTTNCRHNLFLQIQFIVSHYQNTCIFHYLNVEFIASISCTLSHFPCSSGDALHCSCSAFVNHEQIAREITSLSNYFPFSLLLHF